METILGSGVAPFGQTDHSVQGRSKTLETTLSVAWLEGAKGVCTPLWSAQSERQVGQLLGTVEVRTYRSGVGIAQWVALGRGDLHYSSKELFSFFVSTKDQRYSTLRRVVRYCIYMEGYVLTLVFDEHASEVIEVWVVDANYAKGHDRKSTTGYIVFLQGVQLCSASKT